jgi:hypothetical protein
MNGRARGIGLLLLGMAGAAGTAGCAADATAPQGEMGSATAQEIANFIVSADPTAGWSTIALATARTGTQEFSRTAPCPAGGTRAIVGSGDSSLDATTRTFTTRWSTTQSHDRCAFPPRDGGPDIVVHGSVTITGEASYRMPEDRASGRLVLAYTTTRVGSTTTSAGDRSRTCEVDLTETFDPATNSFRVVGTVCGRAVDTARPLGGRG